jgi:HK97 family phage major capsid protein/HK97 family phage prohead protease
MNRAYSILTIKAVKEDERLIEGIASTPAPDRMGDIVEPLGAKYKLPMPLLWQHNSDEPVGHVEFAKPNKDGIPFKARIAQIDEPGDLKNSLDKAWQAVKAKLVSAVSIGFTINAFEILKEGGWRITDWEWLELSLVTIPANAEATISSVKSIDAPLLAASGFAQRGTERTVKAGVTASRSTHVVKATEAKQTMKKTIAEQIAGFEAARQVKATRMTEIMDAAAEKGETLDQAEQTEYEDLKADLKSIDDHLGRLKEMESLNLTKAIVVDNVNNDDDATRVRSGDTGRSVARMHVLPKKLPPGIGFTRFVIAQCLAKGNIMQAVEIAKSNQRWKEETPEVELALKTAVTPGATTDTAWSNGLVNYQILTAEFIEYLRPLTIIGRIPGLTRVPFNVKIGRQTGAATVNWVGQGAPKPLTSLAFDNVTLDLAKIAGIIVLNDELVKISNPAAEALVQSDLAKAIVQFMDAQFVDPTKAAVSGVSPASITNGVTAITPTGTTGAAFRADMKTMLGQFLTNNMQVNGTVLLMPQRLALGISLMTNSLGQREFPNLTMNGGELLGLPVITSEGIPSTGGSPTDGDPIIAVSAPDILLADDGVVTIDASREASLQMDTAPDSPATASTVMVSMFQQNQVAIRAERYINWAKRRSTAVSYISNGKYFE